MTVFLRLLWLMARALLGARRLVTERRALRLRAWPHEAGFAFMHQHTYLQLMEVGRWELFTGSGSLGKVMREGWVPVVASQHISYRRPIRRFQRFELYTHVAYWDEKDVWIEQDFMRDGELMARGIVRLRLPSKRKNRSPLEVMQRGWGVEPPPAPPWLEAARAADAPLASTPLGAAQR